MRSGACVLYSKHSWSWLETTLCYEYITQPPPTAQVTSLVQMSRVEDVVLDQLVGIEVASDLLRQRMQEDRTEIRLVLRHVPGAVFGPADLFGRRLIDHLAAARHVKHFDARVGSPLK